MLQGTQNAGTAWLLISTMLLEILAQESLGATYTDPDQNMTVQ
jgi:hypothetical protein